MKKKLQVRDWLAKWLIDVEIYGSKVAEGFRRSSVGVVVVCCITTKVILASPHIKCSHIILCGLCLKHFVSSKVTFASMASLYGIAMKHSISSEYVWSNFRYTVFTVPLANVMYAVVLWVRSLGKFNVVRCFKIIPLSDFAAGLYLTLVWCYWRWRNGSKVVRIGWLTRKQICQVKRERKMRRIRLWIIVYRMSLSKLIVPRSLLLW